MRDNQQAMKLSRRSVIASLAAGAAANVPAIAAVAGGEDHPDRELLELGRQYDQLRGAIKAADARFNEGQALYERRAPLPRDVMRRRIEDHLCGFQLPIGPRTRDIHCEPRYSALYSEEEIDLLRDWPADPDPTEIARAAEIVTEWDRWTAECDALSDELGVTEALEAIDKLVAKEGPLARRIAAMPATTMAGLQVRATILAEMFAGEDDEGYIDQLMIRAIVRDLCAMPGQSV